MQPDSLFGIINFNCILDDTSLGTGTRNPVAVVENDIIEESCPEMSEIHILYPTDFTWINHSLHENTPAERCRKATPVSVPNVNRLPDLSWHLQNLHEHVPADRCRKASFVCSAQNANVLPDLVTPREVQSSIEDDTHIDECIANFFSTSSDPWLFRLVEAEMEAEKLTQNMREQTHELASDEPVASVHCSIINLDLHIDAEAETHQQENHLPFTTSAARRADVAAKAECKNDDLSDAKTRRKQRREHLQQTR